MTTTDASAQPTAPSRPLPKPTELSQPYWDSCRRGELTYLHCEECGLRFFPPEAVCIGCFSPRVAWATSTGRGSLYTFSVIRREVSPGFPVPTVFAIVELDEGYHMFSNVVGCEPQDVQIGMRLQVTFEECSDEITLPMFEPAPATAA